MTHFNIIFIRRNEERNEENVERNEENDADEDDGDIELANGIAELTRNPHNMYRYIIIEIIENNPMPRPGIRAVFNE